MSVGERFNRGDVQVGEKRLPVGRPRKKEKPVA